MTRLTTLNNQEWFHSNPKFEFKSRQTTQMKLQTWHDSTFNYLNLTNIDGVVVVLYKVNTDQALNIKIFKNSC